MTSKEDMYDKIKISANNSNKPKGKREKVKKPDLKKQLEAVQKELERIKDQYLRTLAEFENYKKRRERDLINFMENANLSLIEEFLPILDDFERSLNSSPKKKISKSFYNGIALIHEKLKNVLEKQGIESIDAIGKPFDPELHDAIMQIEAKDKPSNFVLEEALKGYKFKDKVIRHSKVVVSK